MRSPFKFLDAFELEDKDVFFGREKEVETLYRMVYQSDLILVYGYSGTGKTSLIQCGLASRFDGPQWHPFFIRKGENINQSARNALGEALHEDIPEDTSLTELVEAILDEYLSPVYLIFDQFEELFILGTPDEQTRFIQDIQELLSEGLSCKVIFSIREEYLGEIYLLEQALPHLFDFKLRVEPMNKQKAQNVLRSSFAAFNIGLEAPAGECLAEIIENVSLKKSGIQLPYLQVYLDQLYRENYTRTYPDESAAPTGNFSNSETRWPELELTLAEIRSFGTMAEVFPRFLEGQKEKIQLQLTAKYPHGKVGAATIRDILDVFVTEEGTKKPVPFQREEERLIIPQKLQAKFPVNNPLLTDAILGLEKSRILRVREGSYELAHDSLAELIDEQRTDEQRQLNEVKVRLSGSHLEWQRTGEYLTRKQLISVEPFLDRLNLEPHLEQFVAKSYAFNEDKEEAERQKQQAKLEKEQMLRGMAEENARQAKRRSTIAIVLAFLAFTALILAYLQFEKARSTTERLLDNSMEDARLDILDLDYDAALKKYRGAADLRPQQAATGLMEIAFVQTEIGRYDSAWVLIKQVSQLTDTSLDTAVIARSDSLSVLREVLQRIDINHYQKLTKRYFPEMVKVPGGTFLMGRDPQKEPNGHDDELPAHEVRLDDFYIARTETTTWQYYMFTEATGRKITGHWEGDNPKIIVSWHEALAYANWLSEHQGLKPVFQFDFPTDPNELEERPPSIWSDSVNWAASGFRLPTEAEWEYAARGGQQSHGYLYAGSNNLDSVAWWRGNVPIQRVFPVAGKKPNELGLYDMSGNLSEWCWDWYDEEYYTSFEGLTVNPRGPKSSPDGGRVHRGGGWPTDTSDINMARIAHRFREAPWVSWGDLGFRVVRR